MGDIFFAINDIVQKQGPSPLNIQNLNGYQVAGETIKIEVFGAPPVIEYSEADDWLRMTNARITTLSAPSDNIKFSFWTTLTTLRTGTVTYSVQGQGAFVRSPAANPDDWIVARGYVEGTVLGSGPPVNLPPTPSNPPTCTDKLTCCATEAVGSWAFNSNAPNGGFKVSHSFTALAAGANDLKVAFWIHLQQNNPPDRLDITKILVKYGPPEGDAIPVGQNA